LWQLGIRANKIVGTTVLGLKMSVHIHRYPYQHSSGCECNVTGLDLLSAERVLDSLNYLCEGLLVLDQLIVLLIQVPTCVLQLLKN
jgi:hypothetical protein